MIVFHVVAYGLLRFVFVDEVTLHFLHQYAILFAIEIAIMLALGWWRPRETDWQFSSQEKVDLTPWRFAVPLGVTLLSCVLALYLIFSPLGLAAPAQTGGFVLWAIAAIAGCNVAIWLYSALRPRITQ